MPANANLNRSAYRAIERLWEAAALNGHTVDVEVGLAYGKASNIRPTSLDINFTVNGNDFSILLNNQAGQTVPRSFKNSVRAAF